MGDLYARRPSKRWSNRPAKYKIHYSNYARIHLSLHADLLEAVDEAAAKDFTTRSEFIRTAVYYYLQPWKRDNIEDKATQIEKVIKYRRARRQTNKETLDGEYDNLDVYDG